MIDTTIDHVEHRFGGNATIGLLASDGAIQSRVYQNRIATRSSSLTVLIPEQISHRGASGAQETVTRSIFGGMMGGIDFGPGLKGGAHRNPVYRRTIRVELQRLIGEFKGRGAQAIILGCTEFSLLREDLEAEGLSIPVVDSLGCLAVKAIDLASNQTGVSPRANIRSRNERAGR
jgi:aspartate/glutamate racemase